MLKALRTTAVLCVFLAAGLVSIPAGADSTISSRIPTPTPTTKPKSPNTPAASTRAPKQYQPGDGLQIDGGSETVK
jgi:hypothetical protein